MKILKLAVALALLFLVGLNAEVKKEQANPTENSFTVQSKVLSENIAVTTFDSEPKTKNKSIIYITDGQKMIENGALGKCYNTFYRMKK